MDQKETEREELKYRARPGNGVQGGYFKNPKPGEAGPREETKGRQRKEGGQWILNGWFRIQIGGRNG